jgi:hypothetical protein
MGLPSQNIDGSTKREHGHVGPLNVTWDDEGIKNKRDNETSIEENDSIPLFIDICYIFIGNKWTCPFQYVPHQMGVFTKRCPFKWTQCFITPPLVHLNLCIFDVKLHQKPSGKIWWVYSFKILQKPSGNNEGFYSWYAVKNSYNPVG